MDRFAKGFPNVMAMLCAGGSGRVDYGAMPYFHSFWPSDNTDPLGRIKIQWGFSHFFLQIRFPLTLPVWGNVI